MEKIKAVVIGVQYDKDKVVGVGIFDVNKRKPNFYNIDMVVDLGRKDVIIPINATLKKFKTKVNFLIGEQEQYPTFKVDLGAKKISIEKGVVIYEKDPVEKEKRKYYKAVVIKSYNEMELVELELKDLKGYLESGYKCNYTFEGRKIVIITKRGDLEEEDVTKANRESSKAIAEVFGAFYKIVDIEKDGGYYAKMVKVNDCKEKEFELEQGVDWIDGFYDSESIEKVDLRGAKRILKGAFKNCKNLKEVILGEGLEEIQTEAFKGCRNLKELRIPKSVVKVGTDIFSGDDVYLTKALSINSQAFGLKTRIHTYKEGAEDNKSKVAICEIEKDGKNYVFGYDIENKDADIMTDKFLVNKIQLGLQKEVINYDKKAQKVLGDNTIKEDKSVIIIGMAGRNYVKVSVKGKISYITLEELEKIKDNLSNAKLINGELVQIGGRDWIQYNVKGEVRKEKIERSDVGVKERKFAKITSAVSNLFGGFNENHFEVINNFYAYEMDKLLAENNIIFENKSEEIRSNFGDLTWKLKNMQVGGLSNSDNPDPRYCYDGHKNIVYHWVVNGIDKNNNVKAILTFGSECIKKFLGIKVNDFKKLEAFQNKINEEMKFLNKVVVEKSYEEEKKELSLAYEVVEKIRNAGKMDIIFGELAKHINNFDKIKLLYSKSMIVDMSKAIAGRTVLDYEKDNFVLEDELKSIKTLEIILKDKDSIQKAYSNGVEKIDVKNRPYYATISYAESGKQPIKRWLMFFEYCLAKDILGIYKPTEKKAKVYYYARTNVDKKNAHYFSLKQDWESYKYCTIDKNGNKHTNKYVKTIEEMDKYLENIKPLIDMLSGKGGEFYKEWEELGLKEGEYVLSNTYYVNTSNYEVEGKGKKYNLEDTSLKDNIEIWQDFKEAIAKDDRRYSKGNIQDENEEIRRLEKYIEKTKYNELKDGETSVLMRGYYGDTCSYFVLANNKEMLAYDDGYGQLIVDGEKNYQYYFDKGIRDINEERIYYCNVIIKDSVQMFKKVGAFDKVQVCKKNISEFLGKHKDELQKEFIKGKKDFEVKKEEIKRKRIKEVEAELDKLLLDKVRAVREQLFYNKNGREYAVSYKYNTAIDKNKIIFFNGDVIYDIRNKKFKYGEITEERIGRYGKTAQEIINYVSPEEYVLCYMFDKSNEFFDKTAEETTVEDYKRAVNNDGVIRKAVEYVEILQRSIEQKGSDKIYYQFKDGEVDKNNIYRVGQGYGFINKTLVFDKYKYCDVELIKKMYDFIMKLDVKNVYVKGDTDDEYYLENYNYYIEKVEEESKKEKEKVEIKLKGEEKEEKVNTKEVKKNKNIIKNDIYSMLSKGNMDNKTRAMVKGKKIIFIASGLDCVKYDTREGLVLNGVSLKNDYGRADIKGTKVIELDRKIDLYKGNGKVEVEELNEDVEKEMMKLYNERLGVVADELEGKYKEVVENIGSVKEWGGSYASLYSDIAKKPFSSLSSSQLKCINYAYSSLKKYKGE